MGCIFPRLGRSAGRKASWRSGSPRCLALTGSTSCSPTQSLTKTASQWGCGSAGLRLTYAQFAEVLPHLPGLRRDDVIVLASCELGRGAARADGLTDIAARFSVVSGRTFVAADRAACGNSRRG